MTTTFEAFANFNIAVNALAANIGNAFAYASYSRSIDQLQWKNELMPWYSWERYHNSREIQRLVRPKSDIDKRRDDTRPMEAGERLYIPVDMYQNDTGREYLGDFLFPAFRSLSELREHHPAPMGFFTFTHDPTK